MKYLSNLSSKYLIDKICLLRVDFNTEDLKDSLRLIASLPTIEFLLKNKVKILILSHRGRPEKEIKKLSLEVFVPFLEKALKQKVDFLNQIPEKLPAGKLFLLENLRFWPGEQNNCLAFAKKLAKLGDFYVNDAFAVCHRQNSSTTQLPKLLPAYAGFLLEREIKTLSRITTKPRKPLIIIFGGAKIPDKIPIIKKLLPKVDKILLGSNAINNGIKIKSEKIIKPTDWLLENRLAKDIGVFTIDKYLREIKKAKTIIWNGPVGQIEKKKFTNGSKAIVESIIKSEAFILIGGGETTAFFLSLKPKNYKLKSNLFLSTGGGAMLEFLIGRQLPGIKALK